MRRAARATGAALLVSAALVSAALVLTACTPEADVAPAQPSSSGAPAASGDGVLRIGTLLPTSGEQAFLSAAQVAGVELAVREINEAGGVLGTPVEVFHRNSGDATTQAAEASYAELVTLGVDVIVGPSSSVLAERLLPLAVADRVALISPSATAPALTTLDDDGLLLRTVPSAALQGRALAQLAAQGSIATLAFDDAASIAVTQAVAESAGDRRVALAETFTAETDVAALAARVAHAGPASVVVSSPFVPPAPTAALLAALAAAGMGGPAVWLSGAALGDYSQALPVGALEGVRGVLEGREPPEEFAVRVRTVDPAVADLRFAAEAYDATVLAALAATVADDDAGPSLAHAAVGVSGVGIKCMSFRECLDLLAAGEAVDYDGISGPLALSESGDPTLATFRVFTYGGDNRPVASGDVFVG